MATTFTWVAKDGTKDGTTYDVEPDYDVDAWTGRELRAIERLGGGRIPSGQYTMLGLVFAVAVARQVPGYTIERADDELTFGRVTAIYEEIKGKEVAERERLAAEAVAVDPIEGDVVMSPTRPGEPGDTPPPAQ